MLADELIGTMLGNYRILAPLGQGGMARVYKARQENLDREVAVKVLPPWFAADQNFVRRFNQEAKLVAKLSHPNIVTVHDASEYRGHLYIVMQLVDGGTLKQRLDQLNAQGRTMDFLEAAPLFIQLASALDYAHTQGVIHRDVKPVNVLLDSAGRPILSDFGIAKVLQYNRDQLTRPGAGVGTPEYMSPEQCQGGTVDGRADIYALGIMLYEALTGRTPFLGDNYPALAHSHIYEPPPRPSSINPTVHPAVEQIILTALMKDRQLRYQRASQMGDALEQVLQMLPESNQARKSSSGIGIVAIPPQTYPPPPPPMAQSHGPTSTPIAEISPVLPPQHSPVQATHTCPNCYYMNKPHMRFCTRCGTPLNICPTCREPNIAGNRFCTRCGRPLHMQGRQ